jgi:hypothetical protein
MWIATLRRRMIFFKQNVSSVIIGINNILTPFVNQR